MPKKLPSHTGTSEVNSSSLHQDSMKTPTIKDIQKKEKHETRSADIHVDASPERTRDETGASEKSSKRKRKRKHKREDGESAADPGHADTEAAPPELSEPKRKKKKLKLLHQDIIFPDANEDPKLTESARKALTYVRAQILSQSDWKFNKARQNWVVRNIWDEQAIPDAYFSSCVKYMTNVRGNTREILIKASKLALDSCASQPDSEITADSKEAPIDGQGTDEVDSSGEQLKRAQTRVKRAKMMLEGLGVDQRIEP